jgi:hypothetical protein
MSNAVGDLAAGIANINGGLNPGSLPTSINAAGTTITTATQIPTGLSGVRVANTTPGAPPCG